jgi:L-threonylcarbamoyladenylate synthase
VSAPAPAEPFVLEVDPARPERWEEPLEEGARALDRGGLVILPTETVYGVAARPDLPEATARVFEAKRRPSGLNLPVLTATAAQAWAVGAPDARARTLAEAFWPGPLTMVLPRTARSAPWELGDDADTVAVRVPDHPLSNALLIRTGPLAVTSANRSGSLPVDRLEDLLATFGGAVAVYLVLPLARAGLSGTPSTVVDLSVPELRVLRAGAIGERELATALSAARPTR